MSKLQKNSKKKTKPKLEKIREYNMHYLDSAYKKRKIKIEEYIILEKSKHEK